MPDSPFRITLDISKEVRPTPPPPRWRKRAVVLALIGAAVIIGGVFIWRSGALQKFEARFALLASRPSPAPSSLSLSTPPRSPEEEFRLGIYERNKGNCDTSVGHFGQALKPDTPLSKDDRERAWFWKGLCEYESGNKEEALASFKQVQALHPPDTDTIADDWIATILRSQ